jgi:hypothetical protein
VPASWRDASPFCDSTGSLADVELTFQVDLVAAVVAGDTGSLGVLNLAASWAQPRLPRSFAGASRCAATAGACETARTFLLGATLGVAHLSAAANVRLRAGRQVCIHYAPGRRAVRLPARRGDPKLDPVRAQPAAPILGFPITPGLGWAVGMVSFVDALFILPRPQALSSRPHGGHQGHRPGPPGRIRAACTAGTLPGLRAHLTGGIAVKVELTSTNWPTRAGSTTSPPLRRMVLT